ncbi:EamA family transporter [Nocardia testacea]|uniref:EamA family transporter n=1 Tax=Nocardia testacea TaxID=248551 RepID=UPI003C305350
MIPAPFLVLTATVCTQSGQAFGKHLFDRLDPLGVLGLRLGIAAVVVVVAFRPHRMPRTASQIATVVGLGVAIAGMNLIYPALQYLPLGVASTIQLLGPLTVAVAGLRSARDLAVVALVACGLWLIRDPASGQLHWLGFLLAGMSATAMAAYLLLSRALAATLGHSALAIALPVAACLGLPAGVASNGAAVFQPQILALGAAVAILSAVIPYSLEMAALKHVPAGTAGILLSLEPVVAALAGLLVLDETLSAPQWFAITCICAATVVAVGSSGPGGETARGAGYRAPGGASDRKFRFRGRRWGDDPGEFTASGSGSRRRRCTVWISRGGSAFRSSPAPRRRDGAGSGRPAPDRDRA